MEKINDSIKNESYCKCVDSQEISEVAYDVDYVNDESTGIVFIDFCEECEKYVKESSIIRHYKYTGYE